MTLDSAPRLLAPATGLAPAGLAEIDSILATGRELSSAKALLDLMRQVLEDVDMLAVEAERLLGLMAAPRLPEGKWPSLLGRFQHTVQEILSLLAASRHVGQMLIAGGGEGGQGRAVALLERIAAQLPRPPQDQDEARQIRAGLGALVLAIAEARHSFASQRGLVEEQLSLSLERLDDQQASLGALQDSDLLKEAARLQALQIRQQLAGHAIGLGALVPRCLLDLRGG